MRTYPSHSYLDSPERVENLRDTIHRKPVLKKFYEDVYARYAQCIANTPEGGLVVELGSGGGFAKSVISKIITTDILPYEGIDQVVDAMKMPFASGSLRALCLLNVFHHIPNVEAFLFEAERCLIPGGRILIVDQHYGWISGLILKHAHHEPFHPKASQWAFDTSGPLSGANGALAWIVFERDKNKLVTRFPNLEVEKYTPHTPLTYWLAGGLKSWSLIPNFAYRAATWLDRILLRVSPQFGSFVDIEIVKKTTITLG